MPPLLEPESSTDNSSARRDIFLQQHGLPISPSVSGPIPACTTTVDDESSPKRRMMVSSSASPFVDSDGSKQHNENNNYNLANQTSRRISQRGKRGTKRMFLTASIMTVYVIWLSLVLFGYSRLSVWHMASIMERYGRPNNGDGSVLVPVQSNHSRPTNLRPAAIGAESISVQMVNQSRSDDEDGGGDDDDDSDDEKTPKTTQNDTILHIIHSRFMQNQPNLTQLGEARLQLFQHFFLRSLEGQSSKNFVCIIRTDPELDPRLKAPLVEMLQRSNLVHLLVASNETPKSQYQDILDGNIQPSDVWSGSLEDVQRYFRTGKIDLTAKDDQDNQRGDEEQQSFLNRNPPRVLETRLDADDALHKHFVEVLQEEANEQFSFEALTWRLWCVAAHVEWQYESIWDPSNQTEDPGSIIALQVGYCVTPGLSIAFRGDEASIQAMPSTTKHEKLIHTRLCRGAGGKDHRKQESNSSTNCRAFIPMIIAALRARTPTSAGMLNLVVNGTSFNHKYLTAAAKQRGVQDELWWAIKRFFGFSKEDASNIHRYMKDRLKAIAQENLLGQCTRGHSCKNSSQILLRSIVEGSS